MPSFLSAYFIGAMLGLPYRSQACSSGLQRVSLKCAPALNEGAADHALTIGKFALRINAVFF
jgi:hypothetical protein